nr:TolC family protein [Cyanobium sp. ATX 6F1]
MQPLVAFAQPTKEPQELSAARGGVEIPPLPQLIAEAPSPTVIPVVGQAATPAVAPVAALDAPPPLLDPPPQVLPLAPKVKGPRPKSNPDVLAPAATKVLPGLERLVAPNSLALPTKPEQVVIRALRPLGLVDVENLVEVNNSDLKAVASQVDQAKSNLRAQISSWYPNIQLTAQSFPQLFNQESYTSRPNGGSFFADGLTQTKLIGGAGTVGITWGLINPQRVPQVAAARDRYEKAKNQYLIALREKRLEAAQRYFDLQLSDDQVRIGQQSVRASLVSLRDARARYQAGVATKLEVLEAETQLARDQQLLNGGLAQQAIARRALAALLNLPQNVTPTAKEPLRALGVWTPSLQESIVAAYAFREELDNALLDISVSNSDANAEKGRVQPFLNIFNNFGLSRNRGVVDPNGLNTINTTNMNGYQYQVNNAVGLNLSWNLFDGGRANAEARRFKQQAEQNTYLFASQRDAIRLQVEDSFYRLLQNNRNIQTTSRQVISARESLRLARLRFQAGVTTQREVVDNQRDLTQAEVAYSSALADYNRQLAEIRRRTGLDQIVTCQPRSLPSTMPDNGVNVPVPPEPLLPACLASFKSAAGGPLGP